MVQTHILKDLLLVSQMALMLDFRSARNQIIKDFKTDTGVLIEIVEQQL